MQNKLNIVITGGNTGIGLETVKGLYSDGHHIIFGSRNEQKSIEAIRQICKVIPASTGSLKYFKLDLSKKSSVEQFSQNVKKTIQTLDILINNSGLIMDNRQLNDLNIQMTMAINHMGHFYLTYLLFPILRKAKQARIINVSSRMHLHTSSSTSQDLSSTNSWRSTSQYSKSKLANVQFTVGLADRLAKNYPNIKAMCLHPGIVDSQFAAGISLFSCFKCLCCCIYVDTQTGARTSLFLARSDFKSLQSGQYYDNDTEIVAMNQLGNNRAEVQKLWKVSQTTFGIQFKI